MLDVEQQTIYPHILAFMSLKKEKHVVPSTERKSVVIPREIICFQTCKRGMVCKILLSCLNSETLLILHHVTAPHLFSVHVSLLILMSSVSFAN